MVIDDLQAFALLTTANAVPVIVGRLARQRASLPLDLGLVLRDGERLFGSHKTWRGLASGMVACAAVAAYFDLPIWLGAAFAAVSLLADACSSAVKRRMRLKPGSDVLGLDQLAEAMVPLLVFSRPLGLQAGEIAMVTAAFVILNAATVGLRHRRWR